MNLPLRAVSEARVNADADMTRAREETKFLVSPQRVHALAAELDERLLAHRFEGEGANRLPDPHHFVTTVYFDTKSRNYFERANQNHSQSFKIRAREYYDLHPSLAELATDLSEIVRSQPWVWLELKRRDGDQTWKRRGAILKSEMPALLQGKAISAPDPKDSLALSEILQFFRSLEEPLQPSALVNYRRLSWQDEFGMLRVTIDVDLSFYAVPQNLWQDGSGLLRDGFGPALARETQALVEVKRRSAFPTWLAETLHQLEARNVPFSKFLSASQAVKDHG